MPSATAGSPANIAQLKDALYRDGIVSFPGCFTPQWADQLHEDFLAAFAAARGYPGGTIGRGPQRHYFAVPPERVRGFSALVSHPAITALSSAVLGPDFEVVELAFDVPLPGAVNQPWHRDFAMPPETAADGRLSSLAFNITTVDVTPDMAPFEIAPRTHWDNGDDFEHGMFPPPSANARYDALGTRRYPRRGDVSARTGLAIHRGTANLSDRARGVLIVGVVSPEVDTSAAHDLVLTEAYHNRLPHHVRSHLRCSVVDQLRPLIQRHDIEGLMMGG